MSYLYFKNYNFDDFDYTKDVFGFDLDATLIEFNLKTSEYKFCYPNVINKLKALSKNYNIVIITNQKHNKINLVEKKIQNLLEEFKKHNIYISVYCAREDDIYRKPNIGFLKIINNHYKKSIYGYCGDSLGRPNDYSDTDYKFSINLNIPVYSPEEIFLSEPKKDLSINYPLLNRHNYKFNYKPNKKEMVILIGYPASGKSSIAEQIQSISYYNEIICDIINRDTLKTINKCLKVCETSIKKDKNVIIDNTNPDKKTREKFIKLAQKYKYKIVCIEMKTSMIESMHNNYFRAFNFNKQLIPKIAYNVYKSKYKTPTILEGFKEIIQMRINVYDIMYNMYYF